jgi:predicted nucleotidyltransferase
MNCFTKIIEQVNAVASSNNIDFLIIGALARNLFLQNKPNIPLPRWTYDVDVACLVENWEEYDTLVNCLIETGCFARSPDYNHRLLLDNTPLDLIPFGGIEDEAGEIAWPPDFDEKMSVMGFKTALNSALKIKVDKLTVKVINPPLFAILKLTSYIADPSRTKDLEDFYFITNNYFEIIDADTIIYDSNGTDADILLQDNFDYTQAGAELIGRDCSRLNIELAKHILTIINKKNTDGKISIALASACNIKGDISQQILTGLADGISLVRY